MKHQVIYQVMHDEVKVDDAPEEVRAVLGRALQKDTGERYQGANELLSDIIALYCWKWLCAGI